MDKVNELREFIQNWAKENNCYWETTDHLVNVSIFELCKAIEQAIREEKVWKN